MRANDVQLISRQVVHYGLRDAIWRLGDFANRFANCKLPRGLRNDKSLCLFGIWWAHKDSNLGPAD
jgi:hypothetical protein